jgi:hypothetical protein
MTKDNWNIFKNMVLSDIENSDCKNSITGNCEHTDTLEQCINLCSDNPKCTLGYFIRSKKQNYCVPLIENATIPYYRLRNRSEYPETKNLNTYVFVSKKEEYPPRLTNMLFYTDTFNLAIDNLYVGEDNGDVILSNNTTSIQLLPAKLARSNSQGYVPVRNGDEVILSIPNTALTMTKENNMSTLHWSLSASEINTNATTFQIFSTENKKIGEELSYSGKFYFLFHNQPLKYDSVNKIFYIGDKDYTVFTLEPKFLVYYCDSGCKSVNMQLTEKNGLHASYLGHVAYRNPYCWNMCRKKSKNYLFLVFIVVIILLLSWKYLV